MSIQSELANLIFSGRGGAAVRDWVACHAGAATTSAPGPAPEENRASGLPFSTSQTRRGQLLGAEFEAAHSVVY
jgi:hypothetical protein